MSATAAGQGLVEEFERSRSRLHAVAYRMLGSLTEADDAVQEAWLRLANHPPADVANLRPWLTTVVGRICLDMLRARRSRTEGYAGTWLPEPIVSAAADAQPDEQVEQADAVGIALLVVLDALGPGERLAFVLHDVFGVPFAEIAGMLETSPLAARQLASRARRRVRREAPRPDADVAVQPDVVDAFLAAARDGNFERLFALLAPDVLLRLDGGGRGAFARPALRGAAEVLAEGRRYLRFAPGAERVTVNGAPGLLVRLPNGRPLVLAFAVAGGRIVEIDIVADPAKLRRVLARR